MTKKSRLALVAAAIALGSSGFPSAEPVPVRYLEGLTHGFLSLKTMSGQLLGSGDLIQTVRGDRVLTDHLIQEGPSFRQPLEMSMDRSKGLVTVRYTTDKGEQKVEEERMEFPPDLANGMFMPLTKNLRKDALPESVSVIAATPKPMLVKVKFVNAGLERFSFSGSSRQATHYVMKVQIGGLKGIAAKLFGKQPPDSHIWIMEGEAPAFVRAETPIATGDPPSVLELSGPVFPQP
jgi:hypothetical protein